MTELTPPGRRWRWLLGASLALNLVFVGVFAGTAYRLAGGPGAHQRGEVRSYAAPYVRALPRADRRAMFRSLRKSDFPSRAERRALYDEALGALRAEPFEPAALQDLLRRQGDAALRLLRAAEGEWLAVVSEMSADERLTYADRIRAELDRPSRRKDRDGSAERTD